MENIYLIFILLGAFQIKHFICDYPLQNTYMLGKMKKEGWVLPLATHAGYHSFGTFSITLMFLSFYTGVEVQFALMLAGIDFVAHFTVDRLKASPDIGGRWGPDKPYFWWALGLDQMAHHLINYVFIFMIITKGF